MQREKLGDALLEVHRQEPGSPLSKLFLLIDRKMQGHWVAEMWTADKASLHMGTTKLTLKRSKVGAVEDCYAFVPFEREGAEAEVCILQVEGIALVTWPLEEEAAAIFDFEFSEDGGEDAGDQEAGAGVLLHKAFQTPCCLSRTEHTRKWESSMLG